MNISIPNLSLVVLIGPSGSGKSTFARRHFLPTEVLSSDYCRGLVSDDENSQAATSDAFDVLHYIAAKRLAAGRLTVIDATNVQPDARRPLVSLARSFHVLPVAIVLDMPERVCHGRNADRTDRMFGPHVVRQQRSQLRQSLRKLKREGFRHITILDSVDAVDSATVTREPLWNDRRTDHGPFDIIGDVHGCADELEDLLATLGYRESSAEGTTDGLAYVHPEGRRAIFLGDLVDRGPRILDAVRIVMNMVQLGRALCVPGNHDVKLLRKLRGKDVRLTHGLERTMAEIEAIPTDSQAAFREELVAFLDGLVSHYVLDDGKLVVAHAGMKESMQGRGSGKVREFALYGETTGETDEYGLPVRCDWAREYRGMARVVYGHTPVVEPEWLHRTINVDTGCVFGGKLTALRYPEMEIVSVPARKVYCVPAKPFLPQNEACADITAQHEADDILDMEDVLGKRVITTRFGRTITIREENAAAALEVMSRFAVNPKWLIYLPPTMSPSATSHLDGFLEHPVEAFAYFRTEGVPSVVCEEKHMGSRAVVVVCRDEDAARRRFGVVGDEVGIVYTRTGRRFFSDDALEREFLDRVRSSLSEADFWERFQTSWFCLDGEMMPWSAKAQDLLRTQYAAVGAAATAALPRAIDAVATTANRLAGDEGRAASKTLAMLQSRLADSHRFVDAYRHYCWSVDSLDDYRYAPFQLLASEDKVHLDRDHRWHLTTLAELVDVGRPIVHATDHRFVDLTDPESQESATRWWSDRTASGGEGMVVKPIECITNGKRGIVQPGVKCRGREYLRIIYGPDYLDPANLVRLRERGLGRKRSLAMREFALGIEALERFVRKEPLRRVHECVFGVLALESEPVDPRL